MACRRVRGPTRVAMKWVFQENMPTASVGMTPTRYR